MTRFSWAQMEIVIAKYQTRDATLYCIRVIEIIDKSLCSTNLLRAKYVQCSIGILYIHIFYCLFNFSDNQLFDRANTLRGENLQLSVANEKLRYDLTSGGNVGGSGSNAALEARLLAQAEELTTLHRRRGEYAQQIVDVNNKLQETMKELQNKEVRYAVEAKDQSCRYLRILLWAWHCHSCLSHISGRIFFVIWDVLEKKKKINLKIYLMLYLLISFF